MQFIKPLSTAHGADHRGALPEPSYELMGDMGIQIAVGTPTLAIVYRGTWDKKENKGGWHFLYILEEKETCSCSMKKQ